MPRLRSMRYSLHLLVFKERPGDQTSPVLKARLSSELVLAGWSVVASLSFDERVLDDGSLPPSPPPELFESFDQNLAAIARRRFPGFVEHNDGNGRPFMWSRT